jgi:hypothetical protein
VSRAAVLARARIAAEAGMADTCTIRRRTGETTDEANGTITPTWASLYAGKCRVQQAQAQAEPRDAGEAHLLLLRLEVQLPMSVTGLQVGDEVTITAAAYDADLPGRVFLVRDLAHKTDATARRVQVTERTS